MSVLTAGSPYIDINGKYELLGTQSKIYNLEIYNPVKILLVAIKFPMYIFAVINPWLLVFLLELIFIDNLHICYCSCSNGICFL